MNRTRSSTKIRKPGKKQMDSRRSKKFKCQESIKPDNCRGPVVLLARLPDQLCDVPPPTPVQLHNEADSRCTSDPESDSSDLDFLPSNDKSIDAKSPSIRKIPKKAAAAITPSPASQPSTTNSKHTVDDSPMLVSCIFSHATDEIKSLRPNLPDVEVKLGMVVLARRRPMTWLPGKIIEIVEKEDGRFKYKVSFDECGRSLVSGHHLALPSKPKLDELHVGARVVVQSQDNTFQYQPGILAELPCRRNRLRFLVFLDDHTPIYVSLQVLHLVCKPLENSFDDIQDGPHKDFLKQYMKNWPYPYLTQYRIGQSINVELGDRLQRCEITAVDCSVVHIVFQESQRKEWIHRGSMRLEHMAKFFALKRQQEKDERKEEQR